MTIWLALAIRYVALLLLPMVMLLSPARAGVLDINLYPYLSDVETDSALTVNLASDLPAGWSYFGFINLYKQEGRGSLLENPGYYSEQNLRWRFHPESAFDLSFQHNFRSGSDNDRSRLGIRWRINDSALLGERLRAWHLRYSVTLHAKQWDRRPESVWQLEHSFRLDFPWLSDRLYLAGFIDHSFNESLPKGFPANPIVAEAQLGWRIRGGWYAVAEYRLNQYRRSDVNNLALGVEYRQPF